MSERGVDVETELVTVYKALADGTRLRLMGLLVERPRHVDELAATLGVSGPTISHHLFRLKAAGLVLAEREGRFIKYAANLSRLHALSGQLLPSIPLPKDERARTLVTFFDGQRLVRLPSSEKRRTWVLERIATRFEPDRIYQERDVSAILRPIFDDVASLRRALVDLGFLRRRGDRYRRG
ncbi:MAG TPA: metalloregulator ArsR/SmtB family transcription factor [bacterium]|nr:metalloregulator ArsR/SmtB family transcription factor [bacterium]